MKRFLVAAVAAALAVIGPVERMHAADTADVTVSATVLESCAFLADATLAFGNVDPTGSVNAVATTTTTFWCTSGTAYTITDNDGGYETGVDANRMYDSVANYLGYSFAYTPATGSGAGIASPITLDITGTITPAQFSIAVPGTYGDVVQLSITP